MREDRLVFSDLRLDAGEKRKFLQCYQHDYDTYRRYLRDEYCIRHKAQSALEDKDEVFITTRRGTVTGFGQGDVEIRLPGLSCPLWAVQAQSTGLKKGDSGAWVTNVRSELYGMLVGGLPSLQLGLLVPASHIFKEM
ncbi:hypothetical protein KCU97_g11805, partial [Aureobasidium melanogenum]